MVAGRGLVIDFATECSSSPINRCSLKLFKQLWHCEALMADSKLGSDDGQINFLHPLLLHLIDHLAIHNSLDVTFANQSVLDSFSSFFAE